MNRIFLLIVSTLLLACSAPKQDSQNTVQDSSVSITTKETENKTIAQKDSTIPASIKAHQVPDDCVYKGDFKEAWTWFDLNGTNILVLSKRNSFYRDQETEEAVSTMELIAKHFVVKAKGEKPELLWELYDLEKDCMFDLTAEFFLSPVFTDLDNDGIKESSLVYKLACRSDVSPARMKIVMHEGEKKYALRGVMYIPMVQQGDQDTINYNNWEPDLSKLKVKKDDYAGYWGRYENTKDFNSAPPAFLEHARQLWLDNFVEKF